MNPLLLKMHDPGRRGVIQAGKFCDHEGVRVYVFNISDELRFLQGFGVAPCVLAACQEHGIQEIHFVELGQKLTYVTTPDEVARMGVPFQGKRGRPHPRGTYLHLPLRFWRVRPGVAHYPWASKPLWLEWSEPVAPPAPAEQLEILNT